MLLPSPTSQPYGCPHPGAPCGHTWKGDGKANSKTGCCPSGLSSATETLRWPPRRPQQTTQALGGFKPGVCSLTVLGAGSPASRCPQGLVPLGVLGEGPSLSLPAPGGSWNTWPSLAYHCLTLISASIITQPSLCALCSL